MTPEESQKQNVRDNFKSQCRLEALRIASGNKPNFYGQGIGTLGQVSQNIHYDILSEAEKIYQWLIKEND